MNYKKLVTAMSVMTLAAVYTAACIALPRLVKNPGQGIRTRKDVYSNADAESEDTGIKIDFTKKTVVIDSGHGGIDPGKKSDNGILEKDVNLSIAKKLQKKLIDTGFNVVMTREDENGLYSENDDNKKIADMKKRCQIIKDSKADIVVSIHQNKRILSKIIIGNLYCIITWHNHIMACRNRNRFGIIWFFKKHNHATRFYDNIIF